ncbi:MAG: hypothetical protein RJA37_890 [Verrucomicrobiota bacterium]|jgi:uncharacterized membrane protein
MEKLSAFWKDHRRGMLYGALWAVVPIVFLNPTPLFNYHNGPDDFRQYPMQWGALFAMLGASVTTGVAVTALFRSFLRGRKVKTLFLWSPLSLLIGTALYGFLYAQLCWTLSKPTETWSQLTLSCVVIHPAMSFLSVLAVGLVPLAALNTWHLWREVNRQPVR